MVQLEKCFNIEQNLNNMHYIGAYFEHKECKKPTLNVGLAELSAELN